MPANTFGADTDEDVTDWGEENMEEKRRAYSFDPACYTLAEHFLGAEASEDRKRDLAQDLQNTVEMFDHMGIDLAGEAPVTEKGKKYVSDSN